MADRTPHSRVIAKPADTNRSGGLIRRELMQAFKRLGENPLRMPA